MKRKVVGYIVVEESSDYEQVLQLQRGQWYPEAGVLGWMADKKDRAAMFETRTEARRAIQRTGEYAKASDALDLYPVAHLCRIVPVEGAA